jgi:hypothetical protein
MVRPDFGTELLARLGVARRNAVSFGEARHGLARPSKIFRRGWKRPRRNYFVYAVDFGKKLFTFSTI